MVTQESD
jgi:hypothetical protein